MILIVGGAFQGKAAYVKENYPDKKAIFDLHMKIRSDVIEKMDMWQQQKEQKSIAELQKEIEEAWIFELSQMVAEDGDICFTCDEVGMGIVPMEIWERVYREVVGHVCIWLANKADLVIRMTCGCPQILRSI